VVVLEYQRRPERNGDAEDGKPISDQRVAVLQVQGPSAPSCVFVGAGVVPSARWIVMTPLSRSLSLASTPIATTGDADGRHGFQTRIEPASDRLRLPVTKSGA